MRIPVENGAFVASTPDADCSHLDLPDAIVLRDGQDREIGRVATDSVFPYLRDRPISRFDPPRCRPGLGDPGAGFAVLTTGAPVPPDAHTGLQGSSTSLVDWTTARVARHDGPFGSYGAVSFVVARSRRDMPGICLVAIAASGRSDAQCPSLAEAASGLAWSLVEGANSKGLPETGPAVLSGLVPDGVVEVRDGPRVAGVEGNVWAIFLPNGARVPTELTFTRSDGTQRTVERPHP